MLSRRLYFCSLRCIVFCIDTRGYHVFPFLLSFSCLEHPTLVMVTLFVGVVVIIQVFLLPKGSIHVIKHVVVISRLLVIWCSVNCVCELRL